MGAAVKAPKMTTLSQDKRAARQAARAHRKTLFAPRDGQNLVTHFPTEFDQSIIAGFAPIGDEIDVWPLLHHLHAKGRQVCLPIVSAPETPLTFRHWTPTCTMETDRYGVSYPVDGETLIPHLILVPLLAFTASGKRLGYGGGYYDRTLAGLRDDHEILACGVAYAGQEVPTIPTDTHDERLNGILTETNFRIFA